MKRHLLLNELRVQLGLERLGYVEAVTADELIIGLDWQKDGERLHVRDSIPFIQLHYAKNDLFLQNFKIMLTEFVDHVCPGVEHHIRRWRCYELIEAAE